VEKGKSGAAVEPPQSKGKAPVEVKEKSAGPIKAPETIESKGGRQVGTDQKEKPVARPAKAPEARGDTKGGKQTGAEKKESREEKKATKDGLEGKGKSDETK
jgi:hypothetical protein